MSKLVLIGGPPGVGKTSVLAYVERAVDRCACLDADDAWRVQPSEIDESSTLILHLVASPDALKARCARQSNRTRPIEYALLKLEQIEQLPYPRIDTTHLGAEAIADLIVARVKEVAG
jgi:predicted ABC-type ATPase